MGLYAKLQAARATAAATSCCTTARPYANGNIHIGHALNKIIKDIIVKYARWQGALRRRTCPGWDCHGLPIEHEVEKKLGAQKKAVLASSRFAGSVASTPRGSSTSSGRSSSASASSATGPNPYLTMAPDYEATEVRELGKFVEQGSSSTAARSRCTGARRASTALAEAEVEYATVVALDLRRVPVRREPYPAPLRAVRRSHAGVVIWTTTPWTLPANLAVAVHPELEYVAGRRGRALRGRCAKRGLLAASFSSRASSVTSRACSRRFRGAELEGVAHPPSLARSRVAGRARRARDARGGTGARPHGAGPRAGGLRGRPALRARRLAPVDGRGRFTAEVEDSAGERVFEADAEDHRAPRRAAGALLRGDRWRTAYPHCWRCKNPIIFRATEQWFISMEAKDLRGRELGRRSTACDWIPSWGRDRIAA